MQLHLHQEQSSCSCTYIKSSLHAAALTSRAVSTQTTTEIKEERKSVMTTQTAEQAEHLVLSY
jgi:hypothetical protein